MNFGIPSREERVRLKDARVRLEDARVRLEDARVRLEDARVRLEDARAFEVDFELQCGSPAQLELLIRAEKPDSRAAADKQENS